MPGLFAHNLFNGLNTDVIGCSVGELQRLVALIGRPGAESRLQGHVCCGRWPMKIISALSHPWSPRA